MIHSLFLKALSFMKDLRWSALLFPHRDTAIVSPNTVMLSVSGTSGSPQSLLPSSTTPSSCACKLVGATVLRSLAPMMWGESWLISWEE